VAANAVMRNRILLALLPLTALALALAPGRAHAQQPAPSPTPWPSPRAAADPAPLPGAAAPASSAPPQTPTSTSGTALMPLTPPPAEPPPPPTAVPSAGDPNHDIAIDNRFKMLEARLNKDEQIEKEQGESIRWLRHFKVSGFVQPQFLWQIYNAAGSPNSSGGSLPSGISANDITAKTDGTTTNGTFFRLRRARLKTEFMPSEHARFVFEIDPTPSGGPNAGTGTIARNVEAVGIVNWTRDFVAEYGVGIFKVPFSYEILQSDADRPFIERSWGEQNLFPGEYDTGARASARAMHGKLTGQFAVVNGQMIGEKNFAVLPDLNRGKDVLGRLNYDFGPADVGLGLYYGQGQITDTTALKFKQFPRSAGQVEAALHHTFVKSLGATKAFAELVLGHNMDRGTKYGPGMGLPAMPVNIGDDVDGKDERSLFFRVEQDLSHWITLGARYDFYSPDTAQANNARDTYSFIAVVHFTRGLQLMTEIDHAIDNVHAPGKPPPSKQIEAVSSVLQARF
jgi:Phosphate-selective porin O and P